MIKEDVGGATRKRAYHCILIALTSEKIKYCF